LNQLWKIKWRHLANDTPTYKTGTPNQHFTCQLNVSSMCPPAVALRSHSKRRCHSLTLLSMNDCGIYSFCHASTIVRFSASMRRNFDDDRPSAEGHPRWHNQPGSNPSYSVAICRRGSTLWPGRPRPPSLWLGPRFLKVSRFYHQHSVCDDMKRPSGQAP